MSRYPFSTEDQLLAESYIESVTQFLTEIGELYQQKYGLEYKIRSSLMTLHLGLTRDETDDLPYFQDGIISINVAVGKFGYTVSMKSIGEFTTFAELQESVRLNWEKIIEANRKDI